MIEDRHSKRWRTRLPFVLLAAVLLAAFGIGTTSALVWQTETVVSGDVYGGLSLALDSADHPHVSFTLPNPIFGGDGVTYYTTYDGTSWSIPARLGDDDDWPCLALDSNGLPWISYTIDEMTVDGVRFTGSEWYGFPRIGDYTHSRSSLALDSADNPRVSYVSSSYGASGIKYAAYDGSAMQISTVDPTGWGDPSLALDGSGAPRIAYSGDGGLKYASYDGTTWTVETVDTAAPGMRQPSLKLDSAGHPRIAYIASSAAGAAVLKCASYDGTSWTIETVDSVNLAGLSYDWEDPPSLALNAAGQPGISYGDPMNGDLKFAWSDGQAWQIDVVDEGSGGGWTSLALDSAGNPRIAYRGLANSDLKYAWSDGMPSANLPPSASFTAVPDRGLAPLTVAFDAAASSDPDGTIASYAWAFGDGSTGTGVATSHSYASPGTYTATLTVTDNDGETDTASTTIYALTPAEATSDLRTQVMAYGVKADVQKGLTDKLDVVTAALAQGNEKMAVNNLNAFIKLVLAQKGKALAAAQADALIAEAQRIVQNIRL